MVVIGLGTAGTKVARCFEKWPLYEVISLEVGKEIAKQGTVEAYEEATPDFSELFKDIDDEVWFIVAGAAKVAACALAILEQLRHKKINLVHISSDKMYMSPKARLRERVCFGVLQQYARCGLLEAMYLVSNESLMKMIPDSTFSTAMSEINKSISSMIHYFNVYQNTEPMMGYKLEPKEISRIRTFGIMDLEKNEKKLYFPLDNVTETCYIYNVNEENNSNDTNIQKIKTIMEDNIECKTSFAVYSTKYDQSFCHTILLTHYIQQQERI